ncbi:MAG TPA: hypothetical protein VEQ65_13365 [Opitutus sp.]|nr:hypothetical protein [Opitutus sp.]
MAGPIRRVGGGLVAIPAIPISGQHCPIVDAFKNPADVSRNF